MLTLVTGGVRSGKSRYALNRAMRTHVSGPKYFLASAEPFDDELKKRIAKHQEERSGHFITVEEPLHLAQTLEKLQNDSGLILVDCLTLWVSNLLFRFENDAAAMKREMESLLEVLRLKKTDILFVTNEVGLGLIPDNPLGRRYIDELGALNQAVAMICDEVVLMVSGIPTFVKVAFSNDATAGNIL